VIEPEFESPDFSTDVDPRPYLDRVPLNARAKGMFFHDLVKAAERVATRLSPAIRAKAEQRYVSFKDYPLRDHMELSAALAGPLYPGVPTREGMRRLGCLAYPAFAESMVGRVVFGVLGHDLDRVLEIAPKGIELSLSRGRAVSRRVGHAHFRFEMHDIFGYLDSYWVGVVQGPIVSAGKKPDIRIHLETPSDGVMDIRWT
jgi:uncharacterized protein (TIGR02265 family)